MACEFTVHVWSSADIQVKFYGDRPRGNPSVGSGGSSFGKRSGDVNVKCIVDNPLLIFAQFLYLRHVCANLLSVVSLIGPAHVSKIIDYFP